MQIPPSQSHAQPFTLITHSRNLFFEIFDAKNQAQHFDNEQITLNLIAKGRFFCNQNNLYSPIWDCVVPHIYYIFAA